MFTNSVQMPFKAFKGHTIGQKPKPKIQQQKTVKFTYALYNMPLSTYTAMSGPPKALSEYVRKSNIDL